MRDIDISFIATVQNLSKNYDTRRKIVDVLKRIPPKYVVFTTPVYGKEYEAILDRTKILIVETLSKLSKGKRLIM